MKLAHEIDKEVTIESVAEDAAMGAIVLVGRTPVYIEGLERWDRALAGKTVKVTGTLRREVPEELVDDQGQVSHGVPGGRYLLEAATWTET